MSRQRFVYRKNEETGEVECFNVSSDYVGQRRDGTRRSEEEIYGHIQATDGADLSTRRRHREYMKAKGLTVADDYKETWAKAHEERQAARTPGSGYQRQERKEQIGRIMHELRHQKRRG